MAGTVQQTAISVANSSEATSKICLDCMRVRHPHFNFRMWARCTLDIPEGGPMSKTCEAYQIYLSTLNNASNAEAMVNANGEDASISGMGLFSTCMSNCRTCHKVATTTSLDKERIYARGLILCEVRRVMLRIFER